MAGQMNLKVFYAALGTVAVVGAVAIWMAAGRGGSGPEFIEGPVPVGTSSLPGFVLGSEDAPVEIVEYADFLCPACAMFMVLSGPDIKQRLVAAGRARWRFRGYPLHEQSLLPHHAAQCAGEQGKFWEMADQLMFRQRDWATSKRMARDLRGYAEAVGVDLQAYDACMDDGRYTNRLLATRDELQSMGISATPTFDIGRLRVVGAIPYDSVQKLVVAAGGE